MAAVTFCVVVPETERLDRFLADQLALSRTVAARLIADKHVTRDGRPLRASVQLERGAVVSVELPPEEPPPRSYAPAHRDLTFAYEDEHLAVLDKPAGLVVHPGPGHWDDTLVNVLVERGTALAQGATEGRPGIVHRLDRDTSGLLLVAKTDLTHRRLTRMIERREVERVYAALAWGHFAKSPVDIEAPITRHPTDRKRMTVLAGGRHAITHVRVTARFAQTDLLHVTLGTGRTHQIRVHLAHVGHPVVGDREYAFGGTRRVTPSPPPTAGGGVPGLPCSSRWAGGRSSSASRSTRWWTWCRWVGRRWTAGRRCRASTRRWCGPSGAAPVNSSWFSIPTRC